MLSRRNLGVEDKAARPGPRGTGSVRCPACGRVDHHCTTAPLPTACPDCGAGVVILGREGR